MSYLQPFSSSPLSCGFLCWVSMATVAVIGWPMTQLIKCTQTKWKLNAIDILYCVSFLVLNWWIGKGEGTDILDLSLYIFTQNYADTRFCTCAMKSIEFPSICIQNNATWSSVCLYYCDLTKYHKSGWIRTAGWIGTPTKKVPQIKILKKQTSYEQ